MFSLKTICWLELILNSSIFILVNSDELEFYTKYGKLKGTLVDGYKRKKTIVLRGVPYAEPPIGNLRFKNSKLIEKFPKNPFQANENPKACIQFMKHNNINFGSDENILKSKSVGGFINIFKDLTSLKDSEDCLYMNIYIPASSSKEKRQIAIYFHGGMFYSGGIAISQYDFSVFAAFSNVIVAVPQFRLGVFGFLNSNVTDEIPGNMGLLDQQNSIKFMMEIANDINGDANSITLWGSNSGGWSVGYHLLAASSQNLFKRAILHSGSSLSFFYLFPYEASIIRFKKFAYLSECADKKNEDYVLRENTFECIRALNLDQVKKAVDEVLKNRKEIGFVPNEDPYILKGNPFDLISKNSYGSVKNLLMGVNSNEGGLMLTGFVPEIYPTFKGKPKPYDLNQLFDYLKKKKHKDDNFNQIQMMLPLLFKNVNKNDPIAVRKYLLELIKNIVFVCFDQLLLDEYVKKDNKNVYYYLFDHRPNNSIYAPWLEGSQFFDEFQFIIGNPFKSDYKNYYTKPEHDLTKKVMGLWASFIKTGNPVSKSKIKWTPCIKNKRSYLSITAKSFKPRKGFIKNLCKDLTRFYSMGRSFLKNMKN